MAQFEVRNNTGSLFLNDKRGDNEKAPNAKGKALIDGQWFWVSAWTKQGQQGKFQSLSFEAMTPEQVGKYASPGGGQNSPPMRQPAQQGRPAQRQTAPANMAEDEDCPF